MIDMIKNTKTSSNYVDTLAVQIDLFEKNPPPSPSKLKIRFSLVVYEIGHHFLKSLHNNIEERKWYSGERSPEIWC